MTARLFALNGVTEPRPIVTFDHGVKYSPELQLHVTAERNEIVAHLEDGISAFARTQIDTWCRDPSDSTSKIKDDSDYVNTD